MPIRHRHKVGDYLVVDDGTGIIHYASETRRIWNGLLYHEKNYETRQPQEFVYALGDPYPVSQVRPAALVSAAVNVEPLFVGNTNVKTKTAPASHLFQGDGIGIYVIEGSTNPFKVR